MNEAEVNALTGDDIGYWIRNPFMTPDLLVEKVCFWVSAALPADALVDEMRGRLRQVEKATEVADWPRPQVNLHSIGRWSMAMDVRAALANPSAAQGEAEEGDRDE
jgi:hypothetical protein